MKMLSKNTKRKNSQSKIKNKSNSRPRSMSKPKPNSASKTKPKSFSKSFSKSKSQNSFKSSNKSRPNSQGSQGRISSKIKQRTKKKSKFNKKKLNKNKQNYNQANNYQDNPQQQQQQTGNNQNALIQKSKLNEYSSDEQLQLLKQLHNKIIVSPEQNIKHVQTIFSLIKTPNLKIVCKALRVLAQIFVNIAPLQPIDIQKIEQRTQNKITKQQYKVVRFQKILVQQYERFIKMIKQMHLKTKIENFKNDKQIYVQFKKCLLECVIKLYRTLWNFNHNKQLNQLCLKFIKFQQCRQFLKQMLLDKNSAMLAVKSKIIGGISKIIKSQQFQKRLPSDIIKIINCTYIDARYLKKDQDSLNYKKKRLKKKLYKQQALQAKKQKQRRAQKGTLQMKRQKRQQKAKQKLKVKQQVNKQFAEGQATLNNKQLVRHNSQILQQLFYIYFKILVQKINSIFLKDALDGTLKFVHLINIELTQSLIQHLNASAIVFRDLWKVKKSLEIMEIRILIVFTGQSIINGPLSVYNMDDIKMTTHLYKILKDLNNKDMKLSKQVYRLLCITLQQTFIKRRQLSQQIVGSFVRQIAILLKQKQNIPKLYLLELIRTLAYKYEKLSRMFESDNQGFGLNSFNPMCEDPQCSNAIYTQITQYLKAIKSNKSKQEQNLINRNVQKLCKQNFQAKDIRQSLYSILEKEMKEQIL